MILLVNSVPGTARTDSCANLSLCERYNLSSIVFTGELVAIDNEQGWGRYTFKVEESFKGKMSPRTFLFYYRETIPCLEVPFPQGKQKYLVFAYQTKNGRYVVAADRGKFTKPVNQAATELKILRLNKHKHKLNHQYCLLFN